MLCLNLEFFFDILRKFLKASLTSGLLRPLGPLRDGFLYEPIRVTPILPPQKKFLLFHVSNSIIMEKLIASRKENYIRGSYKGSETHPLNAIILLTKPENLSKIRCTLQIIIVRVLHYEICTFESVLN